MKKKHRKNKGVTLSTSYPMFKLAKALTQEAENETNTSKSAKWIQVIKGMLSGSIDVGSRTPVKSLPAWATLEVISGGFATGSLLAGGELQPFEIELLNKLNLPKDDNSRIHLNQYYLSEQGIIELQDVLDTGHYEIHVPEEAALLAVAALLKKDNANDARNILDEISPYFDRLRFYPKPALTKSTLSKKNEVFVQSVGQVKKLIDTNKVNNAIIMQKESIQVWIPFYEQMVELLLETVSPSIQSLSDLNNHNLTVFSNIDTLWLNRKDQLLDKYNELKKRHILNKRWTKTSSQFTKLLQILKNFSDDSSYYQKHSKYTIQAITRYLQKHDLIGSKARKLATKQHQLQCSPPEHRYIRKILVERLNTLKSSNGIANISAVTNNTVKTESTDDKVPEGTSIPNYLIKKINRAKIDTIENLVSDNIISSGDMLADLLPQISSDVLSCSFSEQYLKNLYRQTYIAFRKRRSLLLLNFSSQVKFEEIPWLSVLNQYSSINTNSKAAAKSILKEVSELVLFSFPHAIIPNKLLQEFRSLIKQADLDIPLVDEVAADIFMGAFSGKFAQSACIAANVLKESLYEQYYDLDYSHVLTQCSVSRKKQPSHNQAENFSQICSARAKNTDNRWNVAANGMVIEQQQIITTQNLAQLFSLFNWKHEAKEEIKEAIIKIFIWICKKQQLKTNNYHTKLLIIKNIAYAWRQMVFFISQLDEQSQQNIRCNLIEYYSQQPAQFQTLFNPVINRLTDLMSKKTTNESYILIGWTISTHRLSLTG
ncbi:hypothetical protein [Zooshikella ganghwensis]|uniref:Uncharacterized protein n=1 Tax=Zooshikella ganghwensis TaxID=202772 RepID=A0A4P9VK43_9GAMM|nr:hypothetical protein [Zooshikella ganghwensis]RDH43665.1 hypothetical protein B9G39_09560 [Zooshikella ganghwensis]